MSKKRNINNKNNKNFMSNVKNNQMIDINKPALNINLYVQ